MRRWILAAAATLTLAGCASELDPAPPAPEASPTAPAPAPAPPASRPRPDDDMCGAFEVRGLVGRPRSEIPVPVLPALQRVACTTCAVTQDFNPRRLNFLYDATTGLIKEVRCG